MFYYVLLQGRLTGPPLVWVLWVLQHPQFLKVWVLAPMVFGNFSHISIIFHKNCVKTVMNAVIERENYITNSFHVFPHEI